jgi:hypothetical protein
MRMRVTGSNRLEPWRIGLILTGLAVAFGGVFVSGWLWGTVSSTGLDFAMGGAAVVGLLMVLAGFVGSQSSTSTGAAGSNLTICLFVVLPLLSYLTELSTGWKFILGAWGLGVVVAAVVIARRRAARPPLSQADTALRRRPAASPSSRSSGTAS